MTNLAYGVQLRVATVTDATAKFKIDMHLTDRGPLPDRHVFLKSIVHDEDPKQDNLVRVCRVGDLVEYPRDRDEALRKRIPYWRDVGLTKLYNDISRARVAAKFLKEKVNDLVNAYTDYTDNFEATPGEMLTFPQQDMGILQPLIEDYAEKVEERKDKAAELAEIEEGCDAVDDKYNELLEELARVSGALASLQTGKAALIVAYNAMLAKRQASINITGPVENTLTAWDTVRDTASSDVKSALDPLLKGPDGDLYDAYHTDFKSELSAFKQSVTELSNQIAKVEVEITSLAADESELKITRDGLIQQKEECAEEIASAAAGLNALEQQEADLLDEIQTLCPDFTGEST